MQSDHHASTDCDGCGWEGHPQAFRWFPELGPPLHGERSGHSGAEREAGLALVTR